MSTVQETFPPSQYPLTVAGCHGRISALRAALRDAETALLTAVPYIYNVSTDPANSAWRHETATESLATVNVARERAEAELSC